MDAQGPGAHGPPHDSLGSQLPAFVAALSALLTAGPVVVASARPCVIIAIDAGAPSIAPCVPPCRSVQSVPLPSSESCRRNTLESAAEMRRTFLMDTGNHYSKTTAGHRQLDDIRS